MSERSQACGAKQENREIYLLVGQATNESNPYGLTRPGADDFMMGRDSAKIVNIFARRAMRQRGSCSACEGGKG